MITATILAINGEKWLNRIKRNETVKTNIGYYREIINSLNKTYDNKKRQNLGTVSTEKLGSKL